MVLSPWPSSPLSCAVGLLGDQDWQNPHGSFQGDRMLRLCPVSFIPTAIVLAAMPMNLFLMAGTDNRYTSAMGCTATRDNFAKATFNAISKTYSLSYH